MGLKQSIVVVNEYTVTSPSTGKASRGASPGSYVTRYMARPLATESLAPIRRSRTDDFVMRYMARASATEAAGSPAQAKASMRAIQGNGGVAFGYGQVSLSHEELAAASADLQSHFEAGRTVMKTVLSFDQEYLRAHGVIEPGFVCREPGDYRGNIDQMKLRMAIMHGLDRMGHQYDDLRYVGVIQVDTEHVHCHLAMVDAGAGRLAKDGTQKGKIDDRSKSLLRRGVDSWLDDKQHVRHMSSAVGYERRNVSTFVKRWAYDQMLKDTTPQFLISCLPEDTRLWRAGTNRKEMRKANAVMEAMVTEALERPGSPMAAAMASVEEYANSRRENEGLDDRTWRRLVDDGRKDITHGAINGVYTMLRELPEAQRQVRTPMLDVMSMDYEELAARAAGSQEEEADPLVEFGFRMRSYSTRLAHHREKRTEYHDKARSWQDARAAGAASVDSAALHRFYEEEEEYHAMCAAKYQHFLPFVSTAEQEWYEEWEQVAAYGEKMVALRLMRRDRTLAQLKDRQEAERRGMEVYGQRGGALLGQEAGRAIIDGRIEAMGATYQRKVEDLKVSLAGKGLALELVPVEPADQEQADDLETAQRDAEAGGAAHTAKIKPGPEHPFDEVKGLDLHHLRYDFTVDMPLGEHVATSFTERARRRQEALDAAVAYLEGSGQDEAVIDLPVDDVASMTALAQRMRADAREGRPAVLPSRVAELIEAGQVEQARARRSSTVRLGTGLGAQVGRVVDDQVAAARERYAAQVAVVPVPVPAQLPTLVE